MSHHCRAVGLVITALLFATSTFAAEPAQRLPVPDQAAREKALVAIRDIFDKDIAGAKTPADQAALSLKFVQTAADTKSDPAGQFALLQLAVDMSSKSGDLKTAFATIDDMASKFEFDPLTAKARTMASLPAKMPVKTFRDVIAATAAMIGEAIRTDHQEIAKNACRQLMTLTQDSGDAATKREVTATFAEVQRLQKEFAAMTAATEVLKTKPDDADANVDVAMWEIDRGNWSAALPRLAKIDDESYKKLAVKELAKPTATADVIALANGWWALADDDQTPFKLRLQLHAAEFYATALPAATGLTKTKAEARIAEAAKLQFPINVGEPGATNRLAANSSVASARTPPSSTKKTDAAPASSTLKIEKARWGGGSKWTDVTTIAQESVAKNKWIWATPDFLKADPTPGWRKHLEINYEVQGKKAKSSIDEGGAFKPSEHQEK